MKISAFVRLLAGLVFMALMGLLQGCATAQGGPFTQPQPPAAGKGRVYLYRTSAFFAMGDAFDVRVDGRRIGELPNASFLSLQLLPGRHVLTVKPNGIFALGSSRDIEVSSDASSFYEYDFVTGPLANYYYIGSSIEPRDSATALADLKELKGALSQGNLDLDFHAIHARIDDADAVPGLNEGGRTGYREWLRKQKPRAFVLGRNGAWNSSWGYGTRNPADLRDPTERALQHCEQRGRGPCKVYAVDDVVVWQP